MAKASRMAQMEIEENADFTRQRDFFNPAESDLRVTVVGCGGIGSATAVLLSKLGIPYLTLIDGDDLELHNIPNQFFPRMLVGKPKTEALASMCRLFGYSEIDTFNCMIKDYPTKLGGVVITGLDSMEARKETWELIKQNAISVQYLIDARIGGQEIVIWTVNPKIQEEVEEYEEHGLFSDDDGEEAPCTARAVIDVMGFVASILTRQMRVIASGGPPQRLITMSVQPLTLQQWYDVSTEKPDKEEITAPETPVELPQEVS